VARLRDGSVTEYAAPDTASQITKLWTCVDAVAGAATIPCGLETALPHAFLVQALEESASSPVLFPGNVVRFSGTTGGRLRWVEGLARALEASYTTGEWPALPG
jgi:hypothetical protein